ncbi:MAG: SOS response-associated peptidase family protein [Bacteroidota bacterium]
MCGRYSQLTDAEITADKYDAVLSIGHVVHTDLGWDKLDTTSLIQMAKETKKAPLILPNYNVSHSNASIIIYGPLINRDKQMVRGSFGYTRVFSDRSSGKSKTFAPLNARCEGKQNGEQLNEQDDPAYRGPYRIFDSPFWKNIKTNRCVIPVNYFIEGPKREKLNHPFLVRRGDGETFLLAGIWQSRPILETGEELIEFAIITTSANELCELLGHHRSPVVIPDDSIDLWVAPDTPRESLEAFFRPFDPSEFVAYQISKDVKRPNTYGFANNSEDFIKATGDIIRPSTYRGPDQIRGLGDITSQRSLF